MTAPMAQFQFTGAHREPVHSSEWRALTNWLITWVFLANVGFSHMYFSGSPPRYSDIIVFCVVGLIVRGRSYIIQCLGFVASMIYSIFSFIATLFNLSIISLVYSIEFISELDAQQSTEYLISSAVLLVLIVAACWHLRRPNNFQDMRLLVVAVLATGLLVLVDIGLSQSTRGHYNRLASADTPFSSAVEKAGIATASGPLARNLLIVMVESLGVPTGNDEMNRLLFARYRDEAVSSRFQISYGETTYYSSTTSGEIRELCGRWDEYYDLVNTLDNTCFPAQLSAQGVETSAYHSFDGDFFDRTSWYPNIGFQKTFFREDLVAAGAEKCGGVFPGACDRDVPGLLAKHLKNSDEPQFIYWLTVNSHLPVPLQNNLRVDNCENVSDKLDAEFPMICRQFAIWDSIDEALVREMTASDFPPTDILIVGDHMPPYFDRRLRTQFAPDRVPWILLKWRDTAKPKPSS